ncbi:MAG TPA: hypothetical protein VND87_04695 [Stellaceae bacterium]|nr:hypothetical protein [Stellaceae bacterium]
MVRDRGDARTGPRFAAALAVAAVIAGLCRPAAAQQLPGYPSPMPWPATEVEAAASAALASADAAGHAASMHAASAAPAAPAPVTPAPAAPPSAPAAAAAAAGPTAATDPTAAAAGPTEVGASPTEVAPKTDLDAYLLGRLCTDDLRANEEDRIYGLISLTVRDTLGYNGIRVTAPLVDEAVQDALDNMIKDCLGLAKTAPPDLLGAAIDIIQRATLARAQEREEPGRAGGPPAAEETAAERSEQHTRREINRHLRRPLGRPTAADLSEELTPWEIDAWLDGLSPRERALALFQYASDVTPQEVADAVGISLAALKRNSTIPRKNLLWYFREDEDSTPALPDTGPAIQYREAGTPLTSVAQPVAAAGGPAAPPALHITGISRELYGGWSLLATVTGLPPDQSLDIPGPIIVAAGSGDTERRLIVTRALEITKPDAEVRRFLLKAYTLDGENGGVGYHDTLHLVAGHVDNPEALQTLGNPDLANVEIARCLWHDYGKAADPGLCR